MTRPPTPPLDEFTARRVLRDITHDADVARTSLEPFVHPEVVAYYVLAHDQQRQIDEPRTAQLTAAWLNWYAAVTA